MSKGSTSKKSEKKRSPVKSDLARIDAMRDDDIDLSDIPATTGDFWKDGKLMHGHASAAPDEKERPRPEVDNHVWSILEEANAVTKPIVKHEREAELVGESILLARIRTCR